MKLSRRRAISAYIKLIKNRIKNPIHTFKKGQTELHHILPRALLNYHRFAEIEANKIRLYSKEHFQAHYYLSIIFPDDYCVQSAFYLMAKGRKVEWKNLPSISAAYQKSKERMVKYRTGKTYRDLFGEECAIKIKQKQKRTKLNYSVRFFVDK